MLRYFIKSLLLIILLFLVNSCNKETAGNNNNITIEDYLVRNNEITGWSYSGAGWVANNISELTTFIDGAADIYQRYSFVEASFQQYQGTINSQQSLIKLYIYDQGQGTNASALYADPDIGMIGAINWQSGAGEAAQYVRNGGISQALTFYRDKYFVSLEIDTDSDESLIVLQQFALNVDAKIRKK